MQRYRVLGITDERDSCDCCGRTRLKRTVALYDTETDQDLFYGTTCAARAMKIPATEVKAQARTADNARRDAEHAERQRLQRLEHDSWVQYLTETSGGIQDRHGPDIFRMIEACGGYAAARKGYRAWKASR